MKDFNNFFREATGNDSKDDSAATPTEQPGEETDAFVEQATTTVKSAADVVNQYRTQYKDVDASVLCNLMSLKEISNRPKRKSPDKSALEIGDLLGPAEVGETLRQERWHPNVRCPYCKSTKINRLDNSQQKSLYNYRYHCLDCDARFSDDTATPFEQGIPPLHTWMYCWYLMGVSTSLQYIANKLGLELGVIEFMVKQMQKLFKSDKPLQHFMTFEEWTLRHGRSYKDIMRDALEKRMELLTGDNPSAPKDTREYDRARQRRRDPGNNPSGTTPTNRPYRPKH